MHLWPFFFLSFLYVCIFGCAVSWLLSRLFSSCSRPGLHCGWSACTYCGGFSHRGAQAVGCTGFGICVMWAQESWFLACKHMLNNCGAGLVAPPHVGSSWTNRGDCTHLPLHRRVDSLLLSQQGSPVACFLLSGTPQFLINREFFGKQWWDTFKFYIQ